MNIGDDIIDSRDIIARLAELEALGPFDMDDGEASELARLRDFAKQGEDIAEDWQYGETFIHDRYFQQYAMDLADDLGAIPRDYTWPTSCIDWGQAARELQMDYSAIEVDGHTYWAR